MSDLDFYLKRLNPILCLDTGVMIDEVDRLQHEIEMLKSEKPKIRNEKAIAYLSGEIDSDVSEDEAFEILSDAGVEEIKWSNSLDNEYHLWTYINLK